MSQILSLRSSDEHAQIAQTIQFKKLLDTFQARLTALLEKEVADMTMDDYQLEMMNEIFQAFMRKNEGNTIPLSLYTAAEYFSLLLSSYIVDENAFDPNVNYAEKRSFMEAADQHFLFHVTWERRDVIHPISLAKHYYYESSKQMNIREKVEFCDVLLLSAELCGNVLKEYHRRMLQPQLVQVQ